jgi:predicted TIM-barrel fold metal-dependent hydrolase
MGGKKSRLELPVESPIPFSNGSNGEYVPRPPSEREQRMEQRFRDLVDERTKRLGVSRRAFVGSMAGTATALLAIQQVAGCDGGYQVDPDATWDGEHACVELGGSQFVFDVQTHHVDPRGSWRQTSPGWELFLGSLPQAGCGQTDTIDCFDVEHYIREMFVNSDTHLAVLSAVPANPGTNPLEIAEARMTKELVDRLSQSQRMILHGLVLPNRGMAEIDGMQRLKEDHGIAAWKVYTPFGGWRLDDPNGRRFLDEAKRLAVPLVCAHKGLPIAGFDPAYASPADIGVVAPLYPELRFIVYHSGYDPSVVERAYDPAGGGADRLIKAVLDAGIAPGGNVYAELGSTWRNVMTDPLQAQHLLGKLLTHLGPDRILWGTDSIWYGTPQDQLTAFRALEISQQLQDQHGYPALTAEIKAKILGLNAAVLYGIDVTARRCAIEADDLARRRRAVLDERETPATYRSYGPRTRRELFAWLRSRDGVPG